MRATTRTRPRRLDGPKSKHAVGLWLLLLSADAFAQFSGTATLVSDYRYRGVSLSRQRPAAQLAVAYDGASGWYAGAFASTVQFAYPATRELQLVSFAGYARRTPSGLSWEAGADYSFVTGPQSYSYPEVYVGAASENVSARLYYAPRYFGRDIDVVYGEINATQRLFDRFRIIAHAGVLHDNGRAAYNQRLDHRVFDASVGAGFDFQPFNVQLSWVGITSNHTPYPVTGMKSKNGAVLLVSYAF